MKREYWEQFASGYEEEVFRVSEQDCAHLIRAEVERLASPKQHALDLGCGIGLWLPLLSRLFRSVTAVDIAAGLLRRARSACQGLDNVRFVRVDVSRGVGRLPRVDLVLCVNAILMPSLAVRRAMFHAVADRLRAGGHLVLVVPALESALLTKQRLIDWHVEDGLAPGAAVRSALRSDRATAAGWLRGVVPVDGVGTKHYLREELEALLGSFGLEVRALRKLEYPWTTEFAEPPAWMQRPFPWDWLVTARKRSRAPGPGLAAR